MTGASFEICELSAALVRSNSHDKH